jgi:hypothetical protein
MTLINLQGILMMMTAWRNAVASTASLNNTKTAAVAFPFAYHEALSRGAPVVYLFLFGYHQWDTDR